VNKKIPRGSQKRLLRLISARADLDYAKDAMALFLDSGFRNQRYHFLLSFVISYARPFTESTGIGSLKCEYPDYPDTSNDDVNKAHQRIIDLRNKFFGHSSIYGSQVVILTPGAIDPGKGRITEDYSYNIAKREFVDTKHALWLKSALDALIARIDEDLNIDIADIATKYLSHGDSAFLDTGHMDFTWQ
jgi:hypothetical protein